MCQTNLPPALQAVAIANLGDVLRLLGNLDAAQVTLVSAILPRRGFSSLRDASRTRGFANANEIAKPLTAEDRAPIFVSIANTLRDLGTRDRDRTGRLQPPSNALLTCPTQPTGSLQAGAYYQQAIACYRQAGTLTADLDLLSLQVDRVDALKLVELENFLQCQLGASNPIDYFAEDTGAVIFYPVILADRLEVILRVARNKYQRFVVPVARIELEKTIATFRQNLAQPQYGWNDVAASQLYDWLIRPAQQYLTSETQHLIFVMDGALQNIPVAALSDRSPQEYLIDRYPVAVTPGLQILGAKQSVGNHSGILIGGLTAKSALVQNNKRGDIVGVEH